MLHQQKQQCILYDDVILMNIFLLLIFNTFSLHYSKAKYSYFFFYEQQYIEDTKTLEKHKQNLKKLAKPVLEFLKEEEPEVVDPIKKRLESVGEQLFR